MSDWDDVLQKLSGLAPQEAKDAPSASRAWRNFEAHLVQERGERARSRQPLGRYLTMFKRRFALTITVLLLVAVALSLPPVRAAASDFLGLFRVQKFAAISISPQQMAMLEQVADQGLHPGELTLDSAPPREVTSSQAAEASAGFSLASRPDAGSPSTIRVQEGGSGTLSVDLAQARSLLGAAGANPNLLPDSLGGAVIHVTIYPSVEQQWEDGIMLMQTQSPQVDYPEDVNPETVGEALLQLLGMTQPEARRVARSIDWTNTLVVPVPESLATFNEVRVDGNHGLTLTSVDGKGNALLWQVEGMVYVLSGSASSQDLLAIAEGLE